MTPDTEPDLSTSGHKTFLAFADAEISKEERRRASLETRGISLITVAGVLVTALTAVAAVVKKQTGYAPSSFEQITLTITVAGLIISAAFGVATNTPRRTSLVDPNELLKTARGHWKDTDEKIDGIMLATRVQHLHNAQNINDSKGVALTLSVVSLTIATLALGIATIAFIYR